MIRVTYVRCGLHILAVTWNDLGEPEIAVAFTKRKALKRLTDDRSIKLKEKEDE